MLNVALKNSLMITLWQDFWRKKIQNEHSASKSIRSVLQFDENHLHLFE